MNKKDFHLPSISELGLDLLKLTKFQLFLTLFLPFFSFSLYFIFAINDLWILAILSLVFFSFFTYGSTSHDLVHMNLGLKKPMNDFLLFSLELLSLRSGHAYRLAHLNHHSAYPSDEDIEGAASGMSFIRTLWEGVIFQGKIWIWAVTHCNKNIDKMLIILEGLLCTSIIIISIILLSVTPVFFVYVIFIIMGSWIIPLITSYIPHNPKGKNELYQTRLFRGKLLSIIAMEHLYHLEHHLYPAIPHKNWPKLAKRLDPYFQKTGIEPIKILF